MNAAMRRDYWLLTGISAAISIGALIFYYHQGAILLYGDAVAHINIARRVFDSRTPGLFQLGTVWLPLPHLLDIPFIVNGRMWQTGLGASIPSMIAYVAGTLGMYRLVCGLASRSSGWIAALIYALNPNLIYMQATAMGESLYLALFVWSAVYFAEFVRQARDDPDRAGKSLKKCGLVVSAAMLVRYDGWFLAAVIAVCAVFLLWRVWPPAPPLRRGLINFLLFTGFTGALFLVYNQAAFGNALEFANGPYSARAIQERSKTPTMPTYPGEKSPRGATLQFLKVSRLNVAEGRPELWLFTAACVALLAAIYFSRRYLSWAILWTPIPFYVLCIAWGSVPIYHPEWWPFSYYNVRYGLQLLPAIAVFAALACQFAVNFFPRRYVIAGAVLVVMWSYYSVWHKTPICLREARVNGAECMALEQELAEKLKLLPQSATVLMYCGAHPGALQMVGVPLKRRVCENNHPGWEDALARPAQSADFIVAFAGDPLARAIHDHPQGLEAVATVGTPSQPKALIYRATRR
ncbi:MAG TPA: glycosyltransferase family 39 protein [Candidatus Angelobacter sp.]